MNMHIEERKYSKEEEIDGDDWTYYNKFFFLYK